MTNTSQPAGLRKLFKDIQDLLIPNTPPKNLIPDSPITQLNKDVEGWYEIYTSRVGIHLGFSQVVNCMKIRESENQYSFENLNSFKEIELIPESENVLVAKSSRNYIPFVFVDGDDGEEYMQLPIHERNYKKVSGFKIWSRLVLIILIVIGFTITIIHILIQIFRYFTGKKAKNTNIRTSNILTQLTVLIGLLWIIYSYNTFSFVSMSVKGFHPVLFFLFSIAFALLSFASFGLNIIQIRKKISVLYLSVSTLCLILTIYLYDMGIIGLRTWVY